MICQWFDLKTIMTVFSGLISKSVATIFFGLPLKSVTMISPSLTSKTVVSFLTSKTVVSFLVEPQNQGGGFLSLCLKIDSHGLIIWVSKSPRRFLGLSLKTKWVMVYPLLIKTDRRIRWRGAHIEI
jgi:hypothetical protein